MVVKIKMGVRVILWAGSAKQLHSLEIDGSFPKSITYLLEDFEDEDDVNDRFY